MVPVRLLRLKTVAVHSGHVQTAQGHSEGCSSPRQCHGKSKDPPRPGKTNITRLLPLWYLLHSLLLLSGDWIVFEFVLRVLFNVLVAEQVDQKFSPEELRMADYQQRKHKDDPEAMVCFYRKGRGEPQLAAAYGTRYQASPVVARTPPRTFRREATSRSTNLECPPDEKHTDVAQAMVGFYRKDRTEPQLIGVYGTRGPLESANSSCSPAEKLMHILQSKQWALASEVAALLLEAQRRDERERDGRSHRATPVAVAVGSSGPTPVEQAQVLRQSRAARMAAAETLWALKAFQPAVQTHQERCVAIEEGEQLQLLRKDTADWWWVSNLAGKTGYVPATFLSKHKPTASSRSTSGAFGTASTAGAFGPATGTGFGAGAFGAQEPCEGSQRGQFQPAAVTRAAQGSTPAGQDYFQSIAAAVPTLLNGSLEQ